MMCRSYGELQRLNSFEDRFDYLALNGTVGSATFGYDRYLNQDFYGSRQWKTIRSFVISRDNGCDLGIDGYEIHHRVYIHHMNPMTVSDLIQGSEVILDPEFLISTTYRTHNAIHFGDKTQIAKPFVPRTANDTKLW
jgi:hypothetical protein